MAVAKKKVAKKKVAKQAAPEQAPEQEPHEAPAAELPEEAAASKPAKKVRAAKEPKPAKEPKRPRRVQIDGPHARALNYAMYPQPERKGTYRIALRVGAAKAMGFAEDHDKARAGGLEYVKDNGDDFVFEGSKAAMNTLLKDLNKLARERETASLRQAIERVERVLEIGPVDALYAGAPAATQAA
jgi:hypothetical protein